jgi:signal peptidase I
MKEEFPICIGEERESKFNIVINVIVNVIIVFLILIICFQLYFYYNFSRVYVVGQSMSPTLTGAEKSEETGEYLGGDYLYVDKHATPTYGDIVIIDVGNKVIIKRVIALGGDTIALLGGTLYLNGVLTPEPYVDPDNNSANGDYQTFPTRTVKEGCIFVMGDNRTNSLDSRYHEYGDISLSQVLGVVTSWSLKYKNELTNINSLFNLSVIHSSED